VVNKLSRLRLRIDDDFATYLQDVLLLGSHKWNCDLREFRHINNPDGSIYDHGQQILMRWPKTAMGSLSLTSLHERSREAARARRANGSQFYEANKTILSREIHSRESSPFINRRG